MRKNPGTPGPLGLFYKPLWDLMISCKYPFVRCLDGPVCLTCLGQGCAWPGGQGPGEQAAEACRTKHTGLSLPARLGIWGQNWVTSQLCAPSTQPDPGWCCIHAYVRIRFFFHYYYFFKSLVLFSLVLDVERDPGGCAPRPSIFNPKGEQTRAGSFPLLCSGLAAWASSS